MPKFSFGMPLRQKRAIPTSDTLCTQAGLWPNRSLQCAALLAAVGYDRPCGPIKSLFLLSPAHMLDGRAQLYSSELSYIYCIGIFAKKEEKN